jgi:hypothetical protein
MLKQLPALAGKADFRNTIEPDAGVATRGG